jgi:hypothetical protein
MAESRFIPCYIMQKSCTSCFRAIDSSTPVDQSDAQRSEACCLECQWICWPIFITADLVSFPCRCGHYYCYDKNTRFGCCNKIVNTCSCKSKQKPVITIQPK